MMDDMVSPAVLIPRPDTEILVEAVLAAAKDYEKPEILDLCCGSGCIGVSLAHFLPEASVTLADISKEAIEENDGEYDMADYEGALPDAAFFAEHKQEFVTYIYENLDNETLEYANGRWEALKLASAPCTDIYVTSAVITILLLGIALAYFLLHRYRARFY